jgi:hypothetical protein
LVIEQVLQNAGISSRNPHILPFLAEVVRKLKFPNNSIEKAALVDGGRRFLPYADQACCCVLIK